MTIWPHLEEVISDKTQSLFHITTRQSLSGGNINNAFKISNGEQSYFVKMNRKSQLYMFEAEKIGLECIADTNTLLVPTPIVTGVYGSESYLVLEYIDLQGHSDSARFGQKLAQLHLACESRFGFDIDNTIGSTPQVNAWTDSWVKFWQTHRLGYQLELAHKNGLSHQLIEAGEKLIDKTPYFFTDYAPKASLLHGDLWSGNWSANQQGEPVIYDPAPYYGDHEADLAMTELFGHPGINFYPAYKETFVIDEGYATRKLFYNVYHILNHANLFGGGYISQAQNAIEQLLVS
ncbi:MAG: fructosamine kinase family protein [Gammaproteobacteria bacterium]|nr:fructosamine kinase family protein [Gammaproteobacteria bacterium]